jgi:hypothetical protein
MKLGNGEVPFPSFVDSISDIMIFISLAPRSFYIPVSE